MMKTNDVSMKNYNHSLAEGIRRSPKFEEKGLAQYAINVGLAVRPRLHLLLQSGDAADAMRSFRESSVKAGIRHGLLHR